MSQWSLAQARKRDKRDNDARDHMPILRGVYPAFDRAIEDREELLALVDRMRPYLRHLRGCWDEVTNSRMCECGLDALLREIGGEASE